MLGAASRERVKDGWCAVLDCGNASAVGSFYCHPTTCLDLPWSSRPEGEDQ